MKFLILLFGMNAALWAQQAPPPSKLAEQTFNFTDDPQARELTDWFERIIKSGSYLRMARHRAADLATTFRSLP